MQDEKKYELCISFQDRIIKELQEEFLIIPNRVQFPSCVTYKNGQYTYDLDSIRVVFAFFFKENVISLQNALKDSKGSFAIEVAKGMLKAKSNIKSISNEHKFREEFQKKALEIKRKYFENSDKNSAYNLKVKIDEYNLLLNDSGYDELDTEDLYEAFNDILICFKEDMRNLKAIRKNYQRK